MQTLSQVHNEEVGNQVKALILPIINAGGSGPDVMVQLESVICGVLLFLEVDPVEAMGVLSRKVPQRHAGIKSAMRKGAQ